MKCKVLKSCGYYQEDSFTCKKFGGYGCGKFRENHLNKDLENHILSTM